MQAMTVTAMPRMLPRVEGVEEAARVEEDVGEDVLEDEVRRKRHRRKMLRPGGGALFETRELSGAQRTSCKPKEKEGRGNVDSFIESVRNLKQRLWATRLRRTAVRRQRRSRKGQLRPGVGVVFYAICQEPKEKAGSRKKKKDVETRTRSSNRPGT